MRPEFECGKEEPCVRCGACCHIREDKFLTEEEDYHLRKVTYHESGIIYLYPMHTYTISLNHQEKEAMENNSKKQSIFVRILPKKIMIVDAKVAVIDWFVDHDVCPFYDSKGNKCLMYSDRPAVCKLFPKLHNINIYDDLKKIDDGKRMDFDAVVSICESFVDAL